MQRFTISLDDELAARFDAWVAARGGANRSEAVRDLIRSTLDEAALRPTADSQATGLAPAQGCVATVSYVYRHHDRTVAARLMAVQHAHHDLVVSSQHTHLDHDDCLETVVLRGPLAAVRACADRLVALRGVRHGQTHWVPLVHAPGRPHRHHAHGALHGHSHPLG